MNGRMDTERILDAFLAPEHDRVPDRVIEAALADIARTPQRRALRVPWRFRHMPALSRATGIATVVLVAVVGAGALVYLNSPGGGGGGPGGAPTPAPTPIPTIAPTPAPSPAASEVAPGITGWTTYTSAVYGFTLGYPEDWIQYGPATRTWVAGDAIVGEDAWPYADVFASPEEETVGMWVWQMPVGSGQDPATLEGLAAWAEAFCNDAVNNPADEFSAPCDEIPDRAVPMCLGRQDCRPALLAPLGESQLAFVPDPESGVVTVLLVGREDDFVSAVRYGGAVALLESILTTMDVWTPAPGQVPG